MTTQLTLLVVGFAALLVIGIKTWRDLRDPDTTRYDRTMRDADLHQRYYDDKRRR